LAAVFEVDQTIPNETENPAFWFFSVHGNNIGFFSEHVNT